MSDVVGNPTLRRLTADRDVAMAFEVLTRRLSGSDLTSLLLEVMKQRADTLAPADVLHRYRTDRFVVPSTVDAVALAELSAHALKTLGPDYEPIELAPVAPLGAHSTVARISQNRVVTTIRGSEVAADPTNSLALELAIRRRRLLADDPRSIEQVRLCAINRVTRAQRF